MKKLFFFVAVATLTAATTAVAIAPIAAVWQLLLQKWRGCSNEGNSSCGCSNCAIMHLGDVCCPWEEN